MDHDVGTDLVHQSLQAGKVKEIAQDEASVMLLRGFHKGWWTAVEVIEDRDVVAVAESMA
jgi:hypothetical protein